MDLSWPDQQIWLQSLLVFCASQGHLYSIQASGDNATEAVIW